jgi:hypothetical protein
MAFDPRALLNRLRPQAPEVESVADDLGEGGVEEGPSEDEKYAHHRTMARKAASPAARLVHQKLMAHHKKKCT